MAGLAAVIPSAFRSSDFTLMPSRLPTRREQSPLPVNARLEASEKKRRKQTVYEEDIYNIDKGPELSTIETDLGGVLRRYAAQIHPNRIELRGYRPVSWFHRRDKSLFPIEVSLGQFGLEDTGDYSSDTGIAIMADRPDDVTEEVFSSEGQQTHEVGESSRPPQTEDEIFRTQLVTAVAMFTLVMQNPRFMAFLQPLPLSQSIGNKKSEPAQAQPQVIHTAVSMETLVHMPETMQSPNPIHNAQEQVAGTPVLQYIPVQPATFQQPIVGPNCHKWIIALTGVQVPKRLAQQLEKEKKGKTVIQTLPVPVRKTHKLLRVIAGKASGKKLLSVADASVRPMMEVVRGAVFDILQARLHGIRKLSAGGSWLDLYSGTGSVGIEALSRGCSSAHFVEMDPWIATNVLKANIENADFSGLSVVHVMKTEAFLQQAPRQGREPFDFISVTPPYEAVDYNTLMGLLSASYVLGKETFVIVEYPSEVDIIDGCGPLVKILNRCYGRTHLAIYGPEWAAKS
ncbi:hypothetical protein L7F22_063407 [Adiantum nelumboides]|nr:hypothetical protein [Adiantum nelumboides]